MFGSPPGGVYVGHAGLNLDLLARRIVASGDTGCAPLPAARILPLPTLTTL